MLGSCYTNIRQHYSNLIWLSLLIDSLHCFTVAGTPLSGNRQKCIGIEYMRIKAADKIFQRFHRALFSNRKAKELKLFEPIQLWANSGV